MTINRIKKIGMVILVTVISIGTLTGCGKEKSSDQISYRQYGINCIEAGKYEEAVDAFQKSLDESVGGIGELELDTCMYKAKAQYLMGDVAAAEETYTAVIDYNNSADAHYLRGCMYFAVGEADKAIADFSEAVNEDDKNIELYHSVAETLMSYEYTEQANDYLQRAMNIKCKKANDYMQMGRIYTLAQDYEKAVSSLNQAIDDGENKANFYLGQAYAAKGEDTLAQTYYQEYISSGEADAYELCEIGKNQMSIKDYETAVTYFKAALELEAVPNEQNIMRNMVIAYEQLGDFSAAKEAMAEYVDRYPDDYEAEDEYTFLQTR